METANFVIIARGGRYVQPYLVQIELNSSDQACIDFLADEPVCNFDDWCDVVLNELVNDLEDAGASAVVLSLEEYRELPKY